MIANSKNSPSAGIGILAKRLATGEVFVLVGAGYAKGYLDKSPDFQELSRGVWEQAAAKDIRDDLLPAKRSEREALFRDKPGEAFDLLRLTIRRDGPMPPADLDRRFLELIRATLEEQTPEWRLATLEQSYFAALREGMPPDERLAAMITIPRLAKERLIAEAVTTNYDDLLELGCTIIGMPGSRHLEPLVSWRECCRSVARRADYLEVDDRRLSFPVVHIHGRLEDLLRWEPGAGEPPPFVITARALSTWDERRWAEHLLLNNLRCRFCWLIGISLRDAVLQQDFDRVLSELEADHLAKSRPVDELDELEQRFFLSVPAVETQQTTFLSPFLQHLPVGAASNEQLYVLSMLRHYLEWLPGWILNEPRATVRHLPIRDLCHSLSGWLDSHAEARPVVDSDHARAFFYRFPETVKVNWQLSYLPSRFSPEDHQSIVTGMARYPLYYVPAFEVQWIGMPLLTLEMCLLAMRWLARQTRSDRGPFRVWYAGTQPLIPLSAAGKHQLLFPLVTVPPPMRDDASAQRTGTRPRNGFEIDGPLRSDTVAIRSLFPRSREHSSGICAMKPVEMQLRWGDPPGPAAGLASGFLLDLLQIPADEDPTRPIETRVFSLEKASYWLFDFAAFRRRGKITATRTALLLERAAHFFTQPPDGRSP